MTCPIDALHVLPWLNPAENAGTSRLRSLYHIMWLRDQMRAAHFEMMGRSLDRNSGSIPRVVILGSDMPPDHREQQ